MTGTRPRQMFAPLEYRYALDAVMPLLAAQERLLIRCHVPELMNEVTQRLPADDAPTTAGASSAEMALWVEPIRSTWRSELRTISDQLRHNSLLIVVLSRPLARLLPERHAWQGEPLGTRFGGVTQLKAQLRQMGWMLERHDGIHSLKAMGLNKFGRLMSRLGRVALADRLEFAARLHYRTSDSLAGLSTVALLVARKESL